jgi:Glycosyl transferase family 2
MAQATLFRPLVSVVTPFYNTEPYLAQCIESVLAQTYPHFEFILMDNCSTDGSGEIAESYARRDPRIRLIRCTQFLSQLANYNRDHCYVYLGKLRVKFLSIPDMIDVSMIMLKTRIKALKDIIESWQPLISGADKAFEDIRALQTDVALIKQRYDRMVDALDNIYNQVQQHLREEHSQLKNPPLQLYRKHSDTGRIGPVPPPN